MLGKWNAGKGACVFPSREPVPMNPPGPCARLVPFRRIVVAGIAGQVNLVPSVALPH
jgi:hypothetical protein